MPSGKNWMNFICLNLLFVAYIGATFYLSSLQDIKNNWPQYRCNPMYMPLSDDIETDFVYCIQTMQTNYMGFLLQPLTFLSNFNTNILSNVITEINDVRAMFSKVRTFISSIVESVFGIFLNLVIEFQKITIGVKDLIGKTIGIMVTLMYLIDGSLKTMQSAWNGPAGQMVQALGKCFHPHTKVCMKNGTMKCMKDVDLGEVLIDGSIVECVLKINNERKQIPFYEIKDENNQCIYVTGSHLVLDKPSGKFVKVEKYKKAFKSKVTYEWFSCLITNTHHIPIGNEIFWDWEDHFIKTMI
jgi:hypothetical protein